MKMLPTINRICNVLTICSVLLVICSNQYYPCVTGQLAPKTVDAQLLATQNRVVKWAIDNQTKLLSETIKKYKDSLSHRFSDEYLFELGCMVVEIAELSSSIHLKDSDFDIIGEMQRSVVSQIQDRKLAPRSYEFDCVGWRILAASQRKKADLEHGMSLYRSHPNRLDLLQNITLLAAIKKEHKYNYESIKIIKMRLESEANNGFLHNMLGFCFLAIAADSENPVKILDEAIKEYEIAKKLAAGNAVDIRANDWGLNQCRPMREFFLKRSMQTKKRPPTHQ